MVGLHFLKAKTVSAVNAKTLRDTCKVYCICFTKKLTKEDLLTALGQRPYEKGVVKRKDESELISHDNLISCNDKA